MKTYDNDVEKVWGFILKQGYTKAGVAGILGDFEQKSENCPVCL